MSVCMDLQFGVSEKKKPVSRETIEDGHTAPVVRQRYPWQSWQTPSSLSLKDSDTGGCQSDLGTLSVPESTSPELNAFLFALERKDEDSHSPEFNTKILKDVQEIVNNTFAKLAEKYPDEFGGYVVHLVGSVGEGTKVGIYDEFDFVIELPAEGKSFEHRGPVMVEGEDPSIAFHSCLSTNYETVYRAYKYPFEHMKNELALSLSDHWKFIVKNHHFSSGREAANLFHLRYFSPETNEHIDVFCDIAFYVVLPRVQCTCAVRETSHRYPLGIACRRTPIFREREKLASVFMVENVKRVYRLAKLLIRDFLPPVYNLNKITFESPIPSYWLKQIISYMVNEVPDAESWREELIGLRIIQLLSWLQKCFETKILSTYYYSPFGLLGAGRGNDFEHDHKVLKHYGCLLNETLKRLATGEKSTLVTLATWCNLTKEFKTGTDQKARFFLLSFALMKCLPEFTISPLSEYARLLLKDDIQIRLEGHQLMIAYTDTAGGRVIEELSKDDYVNKYERQFGKWPPSKSLPEEWADIYDKMFEKRMRDTA